MLMLVHIIIYSQPDSPLEGFTLFSPNVSSQNPGESFQTFLFNAEGETVHTWSNECSPASMPYLMRDSSIFRPCRVPNPTMSNGGVGGRIQHIAWDGTVLWDYILIFNKKIFHSVL